MKKTAGLIGAVIAALGIGTAGGACDRRNVDLDVFANCTFEVKTTAEEAGWKDVEVTGVVKYRKSVCGDGRATYKIKGLNPDREEATAVVCCTFGCGDCYFHE